MVYISAFADEASTAVAGQIEALKRNGLHMIELRGLDGVNIRNITVEQVQAYAAQFEQAGIRVWAIGSPIGKMDLDGDFETEKEDLRRLCKYAKIFKTDKLRVFSFYKAADQEDAVLARLGEMVAIAAEEGCKLYHENEKEIYGDTIAKVEKLMDRVEGLEFVYDPANYVEIDEDSLQAIERVLQRCAYVHIKDALMDSKEIVPAGLGDGKIREIIAALPQDRDITLTLEPHLALFEGYAQIDPTQLKNKYTFESSDAAFDAATAALKGLLKEAGYMEKDGGFIKV